MADLPQHVELIGTLGRLAGYEQQQKAVLAERAHRSVPEAQPGFRLRGYTSVGHLQHLQSGFASRPELTSAPQRNHAGKRLPGDRFNTVQPAFKQIQPDANQRRSMPKISLRGLGVAQDQPGQGQVGEAARHHEAFVTRSWIENINGDAPLDSAPPLLRQLAAWVACHDEVFDGGLPP